ncbi:hypothetical protein LBMAG56_13610 [Verrucomicrobiota bacterium]|nr:hypothetical protein LBMAG56_13610 [Verrucomicrobiota bacterium]
MNYRIGLSVVALAVTLAGVVAAPAAQVVLVAGGGTGTVGGVPATQFHLREPFGVEFDRAGGLVIVEMALGQRVHRVDAAGILTTIAGTGTKGDAGDGGPATKAQVNGIHNLAIAPNGDIYLADTWNCRIRKIDAKTGVISTVVGTGEKGYSGDGGPAVAAKVGGIYCATFDPKGERLYLADLHNLRVRVLELQTGLIKLVAGNGKKGVPADGSPAVDSPLSDPRAVAADRQGNVYILERGGHALRVVNRQGAIRTVVNASGRVGAAGDGGPALAATMNGPKHLCIDLQDNVIIADAENHLIRKYLPREERIVRVAGTGKKGSAGVGGPPEKVELNRPHGVYVAASGVLYITDSYNERVLKIIE